MSEPNQPEKSDIILLIGAFGFIARNFLKFLMIGFVLLNLACTTRVMFPILTSIKL